MINDYLDSLDNDRLTLVNNLETQGITGLTGNETFTELVPEVLNIPSGGGGGTSAEKKDVNFFDYDGTITNSYTKTEFLALSELPSNPSHEGLTAQGWNWSLADAKTHVTNYEKLNIGQMYVTNDGATRIYIHLEKGRLAPYLGFAINGTATINWGDNTTSTVTGDSISTVVSTQHTYSSAGDYVISISSESTIYLTGNSIYGGSQLLYGLESSSNSTNKAYRNAIKKVELGNCNIGDKAFQNCSSLTNITMPSTITNIGNNAFHYCFSLLYITISSNTANIGTFVLNGVYSLKNISIPNNAVSSYASAFINCSSLQNVTIPYGATNLSDNIFSYCRSLENVTIPSGVPSIAGSAFYECGALTNIKIPSSVTSIGASAFYNCNSIAYFDFTSSTEIPTLASNASLNGIPSDCKIVVPNNLYDSWITASYWSNYSSYIIKESDWNNN